jgi:hypothetical protein
MESQMKKLVLALALLVPLTGCAGISKRLIGFDITASTANPVTPAMLGEIEEGLSAATAGLLTYRRLCIAGQSRRTLSRQHPHHPGYTKQAKPLILALRRFVRENDQVNAVVAFNTLRDIVLQIKSTRATMGVS